TLRGMLGGGLPVGLGHRVPGVASLPSLEEPGDRGEAAVADGDPEQAEHERLDRDEAGQDEEAEPAGRHHRSSTMRAERFTTPVRSQGAVASEAKSPDPYSCASSSSIARWVVP